MGFLSSLFGSSKSQPATTTNVISQKLPEEIAPFAKEVLGEAQQLYKANIERGYDPFTGQTIAPFTPEQQRSMEGISGLVGTSKPLQEEALATYRQGAEQFTGDTAQQYMSPYQQAVTDIEKREATRNFEGNVLPRLEAQAVGAGAMSGLGSRAGVEFAEAQRNQSQLLADIQAKGQQRAFDAARNEFGLQKAREAEMAGNIANLGGQQFSAGLSELGALKSAGEERQQQTQGALDEAYFKFLEEQQFPKQNLAEYSQLIYGNPLTTIPTRSSTTTDTPFQPSSGANLLSAGLGAANIFGLGGGFGKGFSMNQLGQSFGFPKKEGGKVVSGLPVVARNKGSIGRFDMPENFGMANPLEDYRKNRNALKEKLKNAKTTKEKFNITREMSILDNAVKPQRLQKLAIDTDTAAGDIERSGLKGMQKSNKANIQAAENLASDLTIEDTKLLNEYANKKGIDIASMAKKQQKELANFIKTSEEKLGGFTSGKTKLTKETLDQLKATQKNQIPTGFLNVAQGVLDPRGILAGGLAGLSKDVGLARDAQKSKAAIERDIILKGQAMKSKDMDTAYTEGKAIDTKGFDRSSAINEKTYNDIQSLSDKQFQTKYKMNKDSAQRKLNINTLKNSASKEELNKDQQNKLSALTRSAAFQKQIGNLEAEESALTIKLIKEGVAIDKIISEINKNRADASSGKTGLMKSSEFRDALQIATLNNNATIDSNGNINLGKGPIDDRGSLGIMLDVQKTLEKKDPSRVGQYLPGVKALINNKLEGMIENYKFEALGGKILGKSLLRDIRKNPTKLEEFKKSLKKDKFSNEEIELIVNFN